MINTYKVVYKFNNVQGDSTIKAFTHDDALALFNEGIKRFLGGAYKYIKVLDIIEL